MKKPIIMGAIFNYSDKYGDSTPIGNTTFADYLEGKRSPLGIVIDPLTALPEETHDNQVIGYSCSLADYQRAIGAIAKGLVNKPIHVYLDSRDWPDNPNIHPDDYLNVQAYKDQQESMLSYELAMDKLLARLVKLPNKILLVGQAYDRAIPVGLQEMLNVAELNFQLVDDYGLAGIILFSDGRPGGMRDYPILRSYVIDTYDASPKEEPLVKPEVSVTKWDMNNLHNGREFKFFDRMNNGPSVRIWVENGSMYAEITNASGTGRTGAVRKVDQ